VCILFLCNTKGYPKKIAFFVGKKQKKSKSFDLDHGGERGICKERQRRNSEPAERHGLLPITTFKNKQGTPKRRKQKAVHLVWTACVCDQYGVACHGGASET
jgi:hypothetical protein